MNQRVRILSEDGQGHTTFCTNSETGEEIPHVFRVELTIDLREREHPHWQGQLYTWFPVIDVVGEMKMLPPICPNCQQMVPEELLRLQRVQREILDLIPKIGTIKDDELEEEGV